MMKVVLNAYTRKKNSDFVFKVEMRPRWFRCIPIYCGERYLIKMYKTDNSFYLHAVYKNLIVIFHGMFAYKWSVYFDKGNYELMLYFSKCSDGIELGSSHANIEPIVFNQQIKKCAHTKTTIESEGKPQDASRFMEIFTAVVSNNMELYENIKDKDSFNRQITDMFLNEFIENDDKAIEAIIRSMRNFIKAEESYDYLKSNFSVEFLRRKYRKLAFVSDDIIKEVLDYYIYENEELLPNIGYDDDKKILLIRYAKLIENQVYFLIKNEKIKDLHEKYTVERVLWMYRDVVNKITDKEYFLRILEAYLRRNESANEQELLDGVEKFFSDYMYVEELYTKFLSAFGETSALLELSDEKELRFKEYAEKRGNLSEREKAEYDLIYCTTKEVINDTLYEKDTKTERKQFKNMPVFYEYFSELLDWLFKHGVLHEKDGIVYAGATEELEYLPKHLQLFKSYFSKRMPEERKNE